MNTISIITAVYNSQLTVVDSIRSVSTQDYPKFEHIVVEGKSKDRSLEAIHSVKHPRLKLISEPDKGIYDALNKGIAHSSGSIIGFVHSDDVLAHERVLSTIAESFTDPDVEAVYSDLVYVSKGDLSSILRHWTPGDFHLNRLKNGWMPPHPTLYLRKEVYEKIGTYDARYGIAADYDFTLRLFTKSSGKFVYIPEIMYKMRVGGESNRNIAKICQKMTEDYLALRKNKVGGLGTLALKNISKIKQFFS